MAKYTYYGVDDYARAIYCNENCSFVNNERDYFENDEIKVGVSYKESKYNTSRKAGRMCIDYKNDLNKENTISVNLASSHKVDFYFGNDGEISIDNFSSFNKRIDTIGIWTLGDNDCITINISEKENNPNIYVSRYGYNHENEFYSIDNLSIDFIINKIYEFMVSGDVDKDTLDTFNRSFEIVKPCLVLRISELVKNWTEIITTPVKEVNKTISDIDKQIEELKKKQEELMKEQNKNQEYLDSITDTVDGIFANIENEYGHVYKK